jgi:hypothetical protein
MERREEREEKRVVKRRAKRIGEENETSGEESDVTSGE